MALDGVRFSLRCPEDLVFGRGTVSETGQLARDHGESVLVVTDPGIRDAGLLEQALGSLEEAGASARVYDGVSPDPSAAMATECAGEARSFGADVLVGVGGGSVLDVTKAAAALAVAEQPVASLFGVDTVDVDPLPTVLVPTTAGTGSEVSPASVLLDDASGEKRGIVDDALFASAAVVDPGLTDDLPAELTAATGLDAYAHAIGSYMSRDATPFADGICVAAIDLIETHLRDATYQGAVAPAARDGMMLGATMAMFGRVNGGKAAIHSVAYGIQTQYHVPHGRAIAMVLPEVVAYNLPACMEKLGRLGARVYGATGSRRDRAHAVVRAIRDLRADVGADVTLREVGADEDALEALSEAAVRSERHLAPNPRPVTVEDARGIFEQIL